MAAFVATSIFPTLAQSQNSLEQRLQHLEQQVETRGQLQKQMSMQLIELQKEVKELRGIIEEHDYKLNQMQERQRDLYRDIENRLSATPAPQPVAQPVKPSSNTAKTNQSNRAKTASSNSERGEFEAAFRLVRNKEYTKAIASFETFLGKYPKGAYSDNARFWIGQIYFAQAKLPEAEQQFNRLRNEYPDSTKMSAAMLKLAEIKVRQKNGQKRKNSIIKLLKNILAHSNSLPEKGLAIFKKLDIRFNSIRSLM